MKKVTREEARASKYYDYFCKFNMPLAFIAAELEDYDRSWLVQGEHEIENSANFDLYLYYVDNIGQQIERGLGLFLGGSFGVGKTMLEVIALKKMIDYFVGLPPRTVDECFVIGYQTGAELVSLFSYGDDDRSRSRRAKLKTVEVLAIDEITRVPLTASSKEKIFIEEVIRSRAFDLKPTVITSQTNAEDLGKDMSQSLPELIREYFISITLICPSWRQNYEQQ